MRLTELEPHWIERADSQIGLAFLCPCCRKAVLTAFWETPPHIAGDADDAQLWLVRTQMAAWGPTYVAMTRGFDVVPCKRHLNWTKSGDTFDNLTVKPSVDASPSGHWHGHITNGEIT